MLQLLEREKHKGVDKIPAKKYLLERQLRSPARHYQKLLKKKQLLDVVSNRLGTVTYLHSSQVGCPTLRGHINDIKRMHGRGIQHSAYYLATVAAITVLFAVPDRCQLERSLAKNLRHITKKLVYSHCKFESLKDGARARKKPQL